MSCDECYGCKRSQIRTDNSTLCNVDGLITTDAQFERCPYPSKRLIDIVEEKQS